MKDETISFSRLKEFEGQDRELCAEMVFISRHSFDKKSQLVWGPGVNRCQIGVRATQNTPAIGCRLTVGLTRVHELATSGPPRTLFLTVKPLLV